jgi:hypothetical protein
MSVAAATLAIFLADHKAVWQHVLFIALIVVASLAFAILLVAGLPYLWPGLRVPRFRLKRPKPTATYKPAPAATDRWRHTTNGAEAPGLMRLQDAHMSHPGSNGRAPGEAGPPSVRIGVLVACDPLDPTTPPTSQLRASLINFLNRPSVRDLIASLTYVSQGVAWRRWEGHGRMNLEAVLTGADESVAPVAWARLLLPEAGMSTYGSDSRRAEFILCVEPRTANGQPAPALTLSAWHERVVQALGVPASVADFLTEDLGLKTSDDPAAQFGICLIPTRSMAELVDAEGCVTLPGASPVPHFMGFAVADADGRPAGAAAQDFLRQLCDYTLKLDNYEPTLAAIRSQHKHAGDKA